MAAQDPVPLDALLAQAGWARALARQLARDADSADELVQRTWVAALEHPPAGGAPATLRRWMASVMRNFARQDARERERRERRESLAARPERTAEEAPGDGGALDGIEGQRKLLDALRGLPEPYRSTLYARYFEGLAPREIARRGALPVKTVKSRLARGLELLRERLDREHGGRAAWLAWMLPLTAEPAPPAALLGALILDGKLKVVGALAALVCVLALGVRTLRSPEPLAGETSVVAPSAPVAEPPPPPGPPDAPPESERTPAASVATAKAPAPAPAPEAPAVLVQGRVLDLDNRPVGDVRIVFEKRGSDSFRPLGLDTSGDLRSDASGWFTVPRERTNTNALVDDPRWVTVYKAYLPDTTREATIFVAPRIALAGLVLDPDRRPVEGAEVEVRPLESVKRKLERRLDGAWRTNFVARSDASGRFAFDAAPACPAELLASAPGFVVGKIPAPELAASDLVIVLGARETRPALVRGIVVDERAQPIEGAHVAVGGLTQLTGKDGAFAFDLDAQGHGETFAKGIDDVWRAKYPRTQLRVVKAGKLPHEEALPSLEELRADAAPRELTIVLAGETLAIRGTVVDEQGKPVPRAQVTLLDETPFGPIYSRVGESAVAMEASVEELARGGLGWRDAPADYDGRFALKGLSARAYDLAALDVESLRRVVVRGVAAGAGAVRIVLPGSDTLAHVAGRIVGHGGEGVPDLDLHVGRLSETSPATDFVKTLRTDAEGRFDLGKVVVDRMCIQITGAEIFLQLAWQPPADAVLDDLEIRVSRRCPVKVELTPGAPRADGFSFLDAAGKPTENLRFEGPMMSLPERCEIVDGVSEAYATEDTATTLLLWEKGVEVARTPVRLTPGELTILRP